MTDQELIGIARQTARILKDSNCGMDNVVSVIMSLVYAIEDLHEENEHLKAMLNTKDK